ncbi:MATE family efflux transporter [Ihubacter sp. rT4E-8]|uniref:MATE family efflux transporter n=1 Tax=Ihubacter sp. rT4E-8 TaxID=3242369 RepID=UPI003CE91EA1
MTDQKTFFRYVLPSVLAFALSGVYAIVDGFFVGNYVGDVGLSAVNIAYPIVAVIQAIGTGIGMGGAIYYTINQAENNEDKAKMFTAGALWTLLISSIILTLSIFLLNSVILEMLGAREELLSIGKEYIAVIALGAGLQVIGTGLIPFIRNYGGSFYAMICMIAGFVTNIILDYLFVWILAQGARGAALATVISQGVTMILALIYMLRKKQFTLQIPLTKLAAVSASIIKVGIAPFGLAMAPNISLIIINRFSISYGGEQAVATYACIAYIICIIYLILQGVGDGSQPLLSRHYGEKDFTALKNTRKFAYGFALLLSVLGCIVMYLMRENLGILFGASAAVNAEIVKIIPIFLVSVPFVAIVRVTTASFYATEKTAFSYILTFIEPTFMLLLMLLLPPLFGGQIMIWWSTVLARILSAILALLLKLRVDKQEIAA